MTANQQACAIPAKKQHVPVARFPFLCNGSQWWVIISGCFESSAPRATSRLRSLRNRRNARSASRWASDSSSAAVARPVRGTSSQLSAPDSRTTGGPSLSDTAGAKPGRSQVRWKASGRSGLPSLHLQSGSLACAQSHCSILERGVMHRSSQTHHVTQMAGVKERVLRLWMSARLTQRMHGGSTAVRAGSRAMQTR